MHIVTVQFDHVGKDNFDRLLAVFRKSVNHHMPDVEVVEYRIPAPERDIERTRKLKDNSVKLKIWRDHLATATEPVIFADCDMVCLRPAYHAFDLEFDAAFTWHRKKPGKFPMNGGIVMARPTEAARAFFDLWLEINDRMYASPNFHCKWQIKYGGMNQSALGYICETEKFAAKVHEYETQEWNAVDCDWQYLTDETVFLHMKSKLRNMVLLDNRPTGVCAEPMKLWYAERDR